MNPNEAPRVPGWTTATEISEELGVSRQTVNQMFWAGEFKTLHRVGGDSKKPFYVVKTSEFEKVKETRAFPRGKAAAEARAAEEQSGNKS